MTAERESHLEIKSRQEFVSDGFIDPHDFTDSTQLESLMWNKKITAVYLGDAEPITYENLTMTEFSDLKGYGLKLPNESVLLISSYFRAPENNQPLSDWLFKIE